MALESTVPVLTEGPLCVDFSSRPLISGPEHTDPVAIRRTGQRQTQDYMSFLGLRHLESMTLSERTDLNSWEDASS